MADDRGTVLPALLVLVAGGMLIVWLAVDFGRWASATREAAFAADVGAAAGAAMLSESEAYAGRLRLDPALAAGAATEAALRVSPHAGRWAAPAATDREVCVRVGQPFRSVFLRAVGVPAAEVSGSACARPAQG